MARIGQEFDRPATDLVESFRDLPTAILADVAQGEIVMDHDIKPVSAARATVGTAVTVSPPPADNLTVHKALTLAEPGDVLVVDAGGYREAAIWGELLSKSAQAHDLAGTVVDGAVRDADEIDSLGYPVYARAVSPNPPGKEAVGAINVPVTCGGVGVDPGDIVVGDAAGIAVIESETAPAVRQDASSKLDREGELRDRVANGEYLYDVLDLAERFERRLDDSPRSESGDPDEDA